MAGVTTGLSRLFKAGGLEVRYTFYWKQSINHSLHEFWLKDVTLYQTLSFLSSWEVVGAFLQCYCLPMGPISMESELCWKKSISQKSESEIGNGVELNVRYFKCKVGRGKIRSELRGDQPGHWRGELTVESIAKFYKTSEKCTGQNVIFELRFFALYLTCQQRTLRFDKHLFKTYPFPIFRQQLRRRTQLFRPGSIPLPKKGLLSSAQLCPACLH